VRRLAAAAVTLLVVSVLVFAATEVLPGDAAGAVLGRTATPEQLAELRVEMGLDRPAAGRYLDWLGGLMTGDLGDSAAGFAQGGELPIWETISGKIGNSLVLAGVTTLILVPLTLGLGVLAAVRAGRPTDHAISILTLAIVALPEFVIGALLILLFFTTLDVLPPVTLLDEGQSALTQPRELVLPVLTLLGASLASSIRMVRAGMIEALRSDYVEAARLAGFRERRVIVREALRNALAPSVQVLALNLQYLVGGIIVVEYLFNYPGLGRELVEAVAIRDVREVQSVAILFAVIYVGINILADLAVVLLVPKLRTQA
jgi:peptide/nickel transport system permease protein